MKQNHGRFHCRERPSGRHGVRDGRPSPYHGRASVRIHKIMVREAKKHHQCRALLIGPMRLLTVGFNVASVRAVAMGSATAVRVAIMVASARERPCLPSNLPCRTESSTAQERHEAYLAAPARVAKSM